MGVRGIGNCAAVNDEVNATRDGDEGTESGCDGSFCFRPSSKAQGVREKNGKKNPWLVRNLLFQKELLDQ